MALPGQSFKRVIVLLLDCGATMQQTLRGDFSDALVAQTEALSSSFASSGGASSPSPLSKKADSTPSQVPLSPDSVPSISAADRSADLSSFHAMKRAARAYVQRLAATSAKVDVGVVCFGSCRTDNPLAPVEGDIQPGDTGDAEEGYKHVEVSLRPESASWKLVQELEKVKNSANRSDAIDGLVVAVDMVEKTYGPKLSQNNVSFLVFSDCQSSPATPEDIPAVRDRLEVLGIRVHFIIVAKLVALLPHVGGGNREKRKAWQATASLKESDDVKREEETNQKEAGDEDKTYGLHLIYLPVAEDMLELRLPSLPSVTPRQLRAVETLVESLTLPGSPQVSVKSGEKGGRASEKDEGDREAEKKPIDGEWEEVEAQRKALQAPASSPAGWQTNAPLEIAVDPSTRVHSPSPPCSSAAFPSFLPDSISSFATKSESLSLHKIHNPTLQRYYQLLVYRHYNPASPPVALGEEGSETQAQTTWREAEESHQHRLHHMWARGSPVERLFTVRTPGCLDSEQPDASVEQTKEAGQRETQVDAALKAAFPQATSLEAQTAGRRQREVQQKLLFGEVVRKQKELVVRDVKVSGEWTEPHFDTPGEEPRMTAEARREETEKLERAIEEEERQKKLEALKALHVHSVNPVRDFQRLLEVKETDLTEKAIQEMTEMIFKFLRAAGPPQGALERPTGAGRGGETSGLQNFRRQQHLGKALVCVEALREGCRRELEGEKFNEFLAEVKAEQCRADAAADDSFRTFWNLLKSRKIGLITHAEDPRVDLEPAQSLRIYEDESVQELSTQTAMTAARPLDPHDVDDLLDLVE